MKKILSLFALGVVALLFVSSIYAQDVPPPNTGDQRWFCLKPDRKGSHDADLSAYPMGTLGKGSPIPGFPVHVFVRIDNKLTTGDPTLDSNSNVLGSRANYDYLGQYGFGKLGKVGLTSKNPTDNANEAGLVPQTVSWHDDLNTGVTKDHFWFGMQIVPPAGNGVTSGNDLAQKFGTFTFSRAQTGSDCAWLAWDPFGYVFDAKTLGPIKGAVITLIDTKTGLPVKEGTGVGTVATNPFTTSDNGSFTFFSDIGKYKLVLSGFYNGITLKNEDPANVDSVSSGNVGYKNLYKKDDIIDEKADATGKVEIIRADIPVVSVGAPALSAQLPQLVDVNVDRAGEQISIKGQVTVLPAVVTAVYKDLTTQAIKEVPVPLTPDADTGKPTRRFEFIGNQVLADNSAFSEITVKPGTTPLTNKGLFGSVIAFIQKVEEKLFLVQAQNVTSIKIDPIPSYLEGITFPAALVGIYLQGSEVPAYQTKADINGHYVIGSQSIPPLPYGIRITKATGEVLKMSTTEYLSQNNSYHKQNNIDSFSTIKTTSSIDSTTNTLVITKIPVSQDASKTNSNGSRIGGGTLASNRTSQTTPAAGGLAASGMQGVIMIAVVLLMLVMIGVGAFVVMKSKQQAQPPQI